MNRTGEVRRTVVALLALCGPPAALAEAPATFVLEWGTGGTGPGQFSSPFGVDIDDAGTVYVVDILGGRVQKFAPDGGYITGWGPFGGPSDVAVDDAAGVVYVTDYFGHKILRFTAAGSPLASWRTAGSGPGRFGAPTDVAVADDGSIFVTDYGNQRVQKFASSTVGAGDGPQTATWGAVKSRYREPGEPRR
jgi:DNA-binding beta-propeller fold protein YncE